MRWQRSLMFLLSSFGLSAAIVGQTQLRNAIAQTPSVSQNLQAQAPSTRIGDLRRSNGITISGRVTSIVGNDFTLDDGSGKIIVDAGPLRYREVNLNQGEQVTVTGKFSKKSGEFDAFSIRRADSSVVEIRPAEGPPPWAGGRSRNRPRP